MDTRQWDIHQLNLNAQRKRSRDTDSMSAEAIPAINGYSSHITEHESLGEPEWKRRRNLSQHSAGIWENNVQTSLWLAQQNNLAPMNSMVREERSQSSQTIESERARSRDESLNQVPIWSRRPDEAETGYGREGRGLSARESPVATNQGVLNK